MFHGHLNYCQKPPLGGRPNTNPRDRGTPNAHNHLFVLFYHVWGPAWIEFHWISFGWGPGHKWLHTTWFWRCVGTAFGHFILGSHNFMVMALGSCVKWPSELDRLCPKIFLNTDARVGHRHNHLLPLYCLALQAFLPPFLRKNREKSHSITQVLHYVPCYN